MGASDNGRSPQSLEETFMTRQEIMEWLKWVHEHEPDRFLFTMCYFDHNPPAFLHIINDDYFDDGEILPFLVSVDASSDIVQSETGIKTLYKMMLGKLKAPACYKGKPDYIYILGRDYNEHMDHAS